MIKSKKIIVVDDDTKLCLMLSEYLSNQGFEVATANDAQQTYKVLDTFPADLILLDVSLPTEDGLSIAGKVRESSHACGIIMLTGKTDVLDKVLGLEAGADDYVTKPFHLRELLARIRAVLSRMEDSQRSQSVKGVLSFDGWTFDLDRRELHNPSRIQIAITGKEFELLKLLVANAGATVSRSDIAKHFGSVDWNPLSRNIDVLIYQLRTKIEDSSQNKPSLIKTVRGAGYVFTGSPITI